MASEQILPALSLGAKFTGKWHALGALAEQIRYFTNWREVWDAYRGGRPLPELHTRSGLTIVHAPEDVVLSTFQEVFRVRAYTAGFYRPRPEDTVVDLGANIGLFALFLHSAARGIRIACFEPAWQTYQRLCENIGRNRCGDWVAPFRLAVSSHSGTQWLTQHPRSVERALSTEVGGEQASEPVESCSLSEALEACRAERVDLLKLDIEGAELGVIEAADAATWAKIDRVALEYHGEVVAGCGERIAELLRDHGFSAIAMHKTSAVKDQGILRAARRGLR